MRAELPWNVAGIPPEAREAARAAARREGLSVGEWLTRRILRSFSDLGEEREPMAQLDRTASDRASSDRSGLDAWGLPPSPASRRDTEEMLARVSRSESESGDAYRRIEDQLRGVARRLDSSERSQSESNRVISRTAAEMNIAAREQTQAFDQLAQGVTSLERRLEALEQSRASEGLKEAVKGLHLGLSRLADQITSTANQSASQISMVAGNLEQVATRLVDVRADAENSAHALEQRMGAVERIAHAGAQSIDNAVERLEQRLGIIEKSSGDVIGNGLRKLEERLGLMEQTHDEATAPGLEDLHDRLGRVEHTTGEIAGAGLGKLQERLATVEQHAGEIVAPGLEKLDQRLGSLEHHAGEALAGALENLAQRMGVVEKSTQVGAEAANHALDKLDIHAEDRAADRAEGRAELERHAGQVQDALTRLEEWIGHLEQRTQQSIQDHAAAVPAAPVSDPQTGERLDHIEQALTHLVERLEHPSTLLEDGVHILASRIDSLERNHGELLDELRSGLAHVAEQQAAPVQYPQPAHAEEPAPTFTSSDFVPPVFAPNVFEPTDFAPPAPHADPYAAAPPPPARAEANDDEAFHSYAPEPEADSHFESHQEAPPFEVQESLDHPEAHDEASRFDAHEAPAEVEQHSAAVEDAPPYISPSSLFAEPQGGFADLGHADQDTQEDIAHEAPHEEPSAPVEDFLSAARRSARAASEKAETEKQSRFSWGGQPAEGEAKPQSRFLMLGVFGLVVVLALSAGLLLSHRLYAPAPVARTVPRLPAPKLPEQVQTPALSVYHPQQAATAPQPGGTRLSPVPIAAPIAAPVATPERVTQLANAGNVTAETILGLRYLDGTGGTRADAGQAAKWLGEAAAKGQAVAQYRFGTLLERGQGVSVDPVKAVHWYTAAANQGNRKAMHNVAVAYAEGIGSRKDMAEAARWFSKAAALGLSDSQFNLAVLYERGDGVPVSLIDAFKWYGIAAAQGDAESRQRLSVLQTQLSDSDRAAAQRAAAAFHAAPLNRAANVPPETGDLGN
jgi:localization factor PodJL